ncbi:putative disease resistance protein RGA4 [Durio zibethinus]|uniref:Disease resistance protein RGA4 n=1 Tax=Durio zibethinus TaxID=66656 RepID=A0A6P6AH44_DURZI|nr:putative disease resistance protein RGA4 [Durio zibethinus]
MSGIGEAALSALFGALYNKFSSFGFKLASEKQVHKEIEKCEFTLKNINAVLDAENRQMIEQQVKIWLADLQDLDYDVDDILDEFATDAVGCKLMKSIECQAAQVRFFIARLLDVDSLRMFAQHALGARDFSDHLDLKEIGLQIVRKLMGDKPHLEPVGAQ